MSVNSPTGSPRNAAFELAFLDRPEMRPVRISHGDSLVVGRTPECHVSINNPSVSREHAIVRSGDDGITVEDRNSKHGTSVNGVKLIAGRTVRLSEGDVVTFGPESMVLDRAYERIKTDMREESSDQLRTIMVGATKGPEQSLRMLIDVVRSIPAEQNEVDAGNVLIERLLSFTGLERGLILRLAGDAADVKVIARVGVDLGNVSRTVIAAAEDPNRVAHLSESVDFRAAQSVIGAGTREVVCVRLPVSGDDHLYLYLDSRKPMSSVGSSTAEFVGVAARVCSLVFDSIARRKFEEVRAHYARAAEVQRKLLPARKGSIGGTSWVLVTDPAAPPNEASVGENVSGDIVGIAPRPDGSMLAWVGDVRGHGPAAALLMSAAQAWLHAASSRVEDPASTVGALSEFLYQHTDSHDFASLLVASIGVDGAVALCDAGHGHAFRIARSGVTEVVSESHEGGTVVGAVSGENYVSKPLHLTSDERLVITTDGVRESRSPAGEEFGTERIIEVLRGARSSEDDVRLLRDAVLRFSGGIVHDDLTILSLSKDS